MNGSSSGSARNLKSQLLPMIFPGGIDGLPNDGCRRSNFALPDIVRHAARCHLGQERLSSFGSRSDLSLRQRRNDGSDSRQLSIQSRLKLLEGGLDFRWRPAIALIDEQSDCVIDFVRNGACCHFDLL
jgi:hypothetical protein